MKQKLDYAVLAAAVLAVWQAFYVVFGETVVSSPLETLSRAFHLAQTEAFWAHTASTGTAFAMASAISIAGGVVLGLGLGLNRFAGDVADPILGTLYSVPKITLYPLILLAFGLGLSAKVAFGAIHGIFPVAIFTMNAVRNVAPIYGKTARILQLSPLATAATVLAPAALPEIVGGIRIGVALTLLGTIIGELFASTSGLGFALMRATDIHAVADILAITLLLFLFAAGLNGLLHYAERWAGHRG